MFLCEKCHGPKCQWEFGKSYGRCECCGRTDGCYDCHNDTLPNKAPCKGKCSMLDRPKEPK